VSIGCIAAWLVATTVPQAQVKTLYAQPRFDRPSDIRVLDELELRFDLDERIALTTSFWSRFDSDPPSEVAKAGHRAEERHRADVLTTRGSVTGESRQPRDELAALTAAARVQAILEWRSGA